LVASDFGGKRALVISLVLMVVPVVWLYFSYSRIEFYFLGALAGFALTGVQSVSRTMVGTFSPAGKSAEFYGFFAVTGRTSSFIGPTIFGVLAAEATEWYQRTRHMDALGAEQAGHRLALFSIVAFLIAGLVVLLTVNEKRGRAVAAASDRVSAVD
jgi:UMF1 family MFS transporter